MSINRLLPTPTINGNNNAVGASPTSGDGLTTAIRKLLPTPRAAEQDRKVRYEQGGIPLGMAIRQGTSESISLQPALLASPSLAPGSDAARQMTDGSGMRLSECLKISGPVGRVLKTLLDSSQWASTVCYLKWKTRTTHGKRLLFQLAPSTPRTGGIESGLLPTMTVADATGSRSSKGKDRPDEGGLLKALLPTPTSRDYRSDSSQVSDEELYGKKGRPRPRVMGGTLNPDFVSWMMGLPEGWLDIPTGQVETGKCRHRSPKPQSAGCRS